MTKQCINQRIAEVIEDSKQKIVTDFMDFLDGIGLSFERGTGYWKDKFYLLAKFQNETVFFILINCCEDNSEPKGLTIWSGEDTSGRLATLYLDEDIKESLWNHIDICKNCGGCSNPGGASKAIFGKTFDSVCITPLRFDNPDADILESLKRLAYNWMSKITNGNSYVV